jgi:ketosteroid isomerase-like protein
MYTMFVTIVGLLAAAGSAWSQASRPSPQDAESQVRALQSELVAAYIHRDVAALERILGAEYIFVESHGRMLIENFRSGDRVLRSYTIDDDRVQVYGNVAVMTYHYRSNEQYRGQDQSGDFRFIRVFAKREGRWLMVAGQETAVKQ